MFPLFYYKLNIIIGVFVAVVVFYSSKTGGDFASRTSSYDVCIGPGGGKGICRSIYECKPLLGLLIKEKPKPTPGVINFLLKSHCGYEGKNPIVCCPLAKKPIDPYENVNSVTKNPPSTTERDRTTRKFPDISCGPVNALDKVIGGNVTRVREFPWMALIGYKTKQGLQFRCGGSLISPRYVLTAAHCVTALKDSFPTIVRLGEYDLNSSKDCRNGKGCLGSLLVKNVAIEEIIPHPDYFKPELRNDIALIRLAKRVDTESWIRPICLPIRENTIDRSTLNERAIVTGWGVTETGVASNVLRKLSLPIIPLDKCSQVYRKKIPITKSQICAGGEFGKDSCNGDSGGPLKVIGTNPSGDPVYVQIGVVSFGPRHCGTQGYPGVYTNVTYYAEWIIRTVKD